MNPLLNLQFTCARVASEPIQGGHGINLLLDLQRRVCAAAYIEWAEAHGRPSNGCYRAIAEAELIDPWLYLDPWSADPIVLPEPLDEVLATVRCEDGPMVVQAFMRPDGSWWDCIPGPDGALRRIHPFA